jgi:hypothetical protein
MPGVAAIGRRSEVRGGATVRTMATTSNEAAATKDRRDAVDPAVAVH